jgi:tripartite-type tricarboxylate transporter receptor subunit TctC
MRAPPIFIPAINRRQALTTLGAALAAAAVPGFAAAADWRPTKPVKIVIPFAPGGTVDILARVVAPGLGEKLGQPVIVDNRPGATGTIASQYVDSGPADGSVLLGGVLDSLSIAPHVIKAAKTDVMKFVPIVGLGSTPFVVIGRPDLPANNLQELLALMRSKQLSFASAGPGSSPQMMALAFARAAKVDNMLHVPFNGMAPAIQALMARQVDIALIVIGGIAEYRNQLKFFGLAAPSRLPIAPEVPTLTEQGFPLVGEVWMGLVAPHGTPANVTATVWKAVNEITSGPAYQAKLRALGVVPLPGTQAEFANFYATEYRKWGEIVRESRVSVE